MPGAIPAPQLLDAENRNQPPDPPKNSLHSLRSKREQLLFQEHLLMAAHLKPAPLPPHGRRCGCRPGSAAPVVGLCQQPNTTRTAPAPRNARRPNQKPPDPRRDKAVWYGRVVWHGDRLMLIFTQNNINTKLTLFIST